MSENLNNNVAENLANESVKELADAFKKTSGSSNSEGIGLEETNGSTFRVATTNLPEKTSIWTKIKNVLFYEIKVELTPKQQKIEDDINKFLHKEITWQSFKNFLFKEVPITYKGKRVF